MLTNNLDLLRQASQEGFAIPAINTQGGNYDIIRARRQRSFAAP